MEYSVKDLLRILLKRWYVILLSVVLAAVAAFFLSRASYQQALKDYEDYTTAVKQVQSGVGKTEVVYRITPDLEKESFRQFLVEMLTLYSSEGTPTDEELAHMAMAQLELELDEILQLETLWDTVQLRLDTYLADKGSKEEITLSEHLTVSYLGNGGVQLQITELTESTAGLILEQYIALLQQAVNSPVLSYHLSRTQYHFAYDTPEYTDMALLSQLVMQKPAKLPSRVKTVGTAAVFGFALSCLVILLVTFVKDSAAQTKKKHEK